MEFMSIVDAKARAPAGCAAVGVYENGDLGIAARQLDKQLAGMITSLHGSGDFSAKVGDTLMLPLPSGATPTARWRPSVTSAPSAIGSHTT